MFAWVTSINQGPPEPLRQCSLKKNHKSLGITEHAFNPSPRETKADGYLSVSTGPTWSTLGVPGQIGYIETLYQNKQNKMRKASYGLCSVVPSVPRNWSK